MVWVQTLHVAGFRNLSTQHWELSASGTLGHGVHVIVGANAQGKSNLLEALLLLSTGRSNRTTLDGDLVKRQSLPHTTPEDLNGALVQAHVVRDGVFSHTLALEARITPQPTASEAAGDAARWRTQFRVNQQPLKQRSQLLGNLPTVAFYSEDLDLLRGAPADRRTWLDGACAQYTPTTVLAQLKRYGQVLQQRNALLRQPSRRGFGLNGEELTLLDVLTQQLVQEGAKVVHQRCQYLARIEPQLQAHYQHLCGAKEEPPTLFYSLAEVPPSVLDDTTPEVLAALDVATLEQALATVAQHQRGAELRRGSTLFGPQRDDWGLHLGNGLLATRFASQGQQRSLVLAIKLAELDLLTAQLGEAPLLLLDDVMAELDPDRQLALLEAFPAQGQVLLSTTHLEGAVFEALLNQQGREARIPIALWHMQGGLLQPLALPAASAPR
jgi:DNA replication and repair protein RecF